MYDFKEVEENLTRMVREGKIAGASAAVYLAGSPVFEVCCGYADLEKRSRSLQRACSASLR